MVFDNVEDTKGNNGTTGRLTVTELRLLWVSSRHIVNNLSIGYATISSIQVSSAVSKLRGRTHSMQIVAYFQNTRFEFLFTDTDLGRLAIGGEAFDTGGVGGGKVVRDVVGAWSYLLGFRIDPPEKFKEVTKMVKRLWRAHHEKPVWGFENGSAESRHQADGKQQSVQMEMEEGLDMDEQDGGASMKGDLYRRIYGGGESTRAQRLHEVIYDPWIGLAVQKGRPAQSLMRIAVGEAAAKQTVPS
ncbi:Bardet-Biedl syndrome 5 protein [Rhizophlyctis rosea]|nr:Bardet-Biedl syndrome 5 protein [Rhizophlyctis rosea]